MKTKNGSIVIMILILMTALVAIVHSVLRTSFYLSLLARERESYEKQYQSDAKLLK
jgi:hypothetical protein